ncbi:hypothetical protein BGZ82_010684 [Podila clonocystis]|nr:hypothetical protein BGZ82_010684 [Podila clonocystis]
MLVASAPIVLLNADTRISSCVHVSIPGSSYAGFNGEHPRTVSEGEKLAISIDPSDCDQSIVQLATPWTMHLGNANDKNAEAVVVAYMLVPGKTEYIWEAHPRFPQEQQNALSFVSSAQPKCYIQVQTVSQDGRELLVGQSEPFAIITSTQTQQQDPEYPSTPSSHPPITRDPTKPNLPRHLKKRDTNDNSSKSDAQAVLSSNPVAVPSDPVAKKVKEDALSETAPKKDVAPEASPKEVPPEAAAEAGAETAAIKAMAKAKAKPPVEEDPDTAKPHYPNIPKNTTVPDPATIPKVSGPNQKSPNDTVPYVPPEVGKAIQPWPTAKETFLKYVGAGAAIFSTVGLGLGGVVGGVVGGTVGFVIGLFGAALNGAFRD